jgi:hypothetical protein
MRHPSRGDAALEALPEIQWRMIHALLAEESI